ncbi:hypothetical protein HJFPF1_08047 [Paramyrothecium foliicola]|nr:hypothetical protein HJFPF1_08047 [Paramyrothecium foliicola]
MDFGEILNSFGGSIFAEECRGDFSHIKESICTIKSTSTHTNEGRIRVCLLQGIFEMLRGDYRACQTYIDEARQYGNEVDIKWKARLDLYERLNLCCKLTPPQIRFRSNLGGSASTIQECELEAQKILTTPVLLDTISSIEGMCESQVIQSLRPTHIASWVSACLHPRFAPVALRAAAETQREVLSSTPQPVMFNLIQMARFPLVSGYFMRLKSEIDPRNTLLSPTAALAAAQASTAEQDLVSLAIIQITLGDRNLSPPFTSPLALNLVVEGSLLGWENEDWDKAEPSFALEQNHEAAAHYAAALECIRNVAAPRLRGAVSFRRACIFHMSAIQALGRADQKRADMFFSEAVANLYSAEDDFALDEAHLQMIACHKLLLDISRGDNSLLEARAAAIGAWGLSSENTALAQFLGILMMRYARRMFLDHSRIDFAQVAIDCARACFRTLEDSVFMLQSGLADAQLKHQSGNFVAAQVAIDNVRAENKAMNHLWNLSSKSTENEQALGLPIVNLFTGLNRVVSTIYSSANDAKAILDWREEYRLLKAKLGISRVLAHQQISRSSTTEAGATLRDASGELVDTEELFLETESASDLADIHNDHMARAYAALDEADIDLYHKCLDDLLVESSKIKRAEDIRLTHKVVAYVGLGNFEKAREFVTGAIDTTFDGCVKSLVTSELRIVRIEGLRISNEVKIDFNASERAISLCYLSHDWERGLKVLLGVERAFPNLLSDESPGLERTEWKLGTYVASIWEHNGEAQKAFTWYMWSLRSLQTQRTRVEDPEARRGMGWSIHNSNLFAGLVRISLDFWSRRQSDNVPEPPRYWGLTAPTWLDQAFLFMEDASARTLLELIITHDSTTLDSLESWSAKSHLRRQVDDLKSVQRTQKERVQDAEKEVTAAKAAGRAAGGLFRREERDRTLRALQKEIYELRRLSKDLERYQREFEDHAKETGQQLTKASEALLAATQFQIDTTTVFAAIPPDTAVVELNVSRGGFIMLGITRNGIEVAHQDTANDIELRKLVYPYIHALRNNELWKQNTELHAKLSSVSDTILKPLYGLLERVEHVIFVPSSIFALFPFSCLLYKDSPLILHKAVSQIPSLSVLERLTKTYERRGPSTTTQRPNPKVFALVHPHQAAEQRPSVVYSALSLYRLLGTPPFVPTAVDEVKFAAEYRNSTIIHIGTHGYQSALSPWQSYLSLAKRFKVMDLAKLKTQAALVVFCACLSGLGKVTNGNDVLGFSHAVLQSGAQVYMGALWKVSELETLLLFNLFYKKLAETDDRGVAKASIAKAWQYAQVTLFSLNKETAMRLLQEALVDWEHAETNGINPADFVPNGKVWLERQINSLDWDDEHFKNPYYWASFSLIGNSSLTLH